MNTLKPLLIVAILGGIGYGVYIRLNAGNDAPPPPVSEDWDTIPKVTLPEPSSSAPWGPPGGGSGGSAPPFQAPGAPGVAAGEAPPFHHQAQAGAPAGEAPPFSHHAANTGAANAGAPHADHAPHPGEPAHGLAPGGPPVPGAMPIHDAQAPGEAPGAAPMPGAMPPGADVAQGSEAPPAGAPPFQPGDPNQPGAAPPADPYADPAAASATPDRYGAPPTDPGPPADYAPPAGQGAPNDQAPPADYPPPGGAPGDLAPTAATPGNPPPTAGEFAAAYAAAQRELEGGQLASALRQLSTWYDNPQLAPAEQQQLTTLLDQVAGTVVYSTQNLLEPPYEVQPGEKLRDIGDKYSVPWQLLAKINGIEDPESLQPGERLKVVRGPFQAVVSLEKRELTLFTADGSYAGRFKCGLGTDQPPQEGTFAVSDKMVNPVYYGPQRAIGADDANNPLGERWIGLGKTVAIHGTNQPESVGRTDLPGSITLTEPDAEDVFDILSLGSKVTIRR